MKLNKTQLRRLIAEERAKLVREQGGDLVGDIPSDLEELFKDVEERLHNGDYA